MDKAEELNTPELKVQVNIDADRFDTCVTILLSRYSDFDKKKYKLVMLNVAETENGQFNGQLLVREREINGKESSSI